MNLLFDIKRMLYAFSVLRMYHGCQSKIEKLASLVQSGAAKLKESPETSLTEADVRHMLFF